MAPDALPAALRAVLVEHQSEHRLPSVAGAVLRGGETVWADAVGLADVEEAADATPEHQYRIGSITKTFTAVAVMQLRAEGRLGLEDRLDAHLDVPAHGELTIRRLLSHGSGLQRELPGDVWESLEFPATRAELLAVLAQAERVLDPGERWHYSNLAFILLGEVVARLGGLPYEEYVERRILEPLGLARTGFSPSAPTATGYSVEPYADVARREPMMVERTGGLGAAGQLWSTVGDLCRLAAFLADPDPGVLDGDAVELMTSLQWIADPVRWSLGYGLGLMLVRSGDRILCGHDGGMPGYLANVLVDRAEGLGAAVLMSGAGAAPAEASLALLEALRAHRPPEGEPWRPGAPPPGELASMLGRWWSEGAEYVFRWHGGRLEARRAGASAWAPWSTFEPLGGDRFRTASGGEHGEVLRLVRDGTGAVVRMYWATYPFSREPEVTGTRP